MRTIAATIGMVLLTGLSLLFLYEVRRTLVWLVVALLFTVTLYPVVGWVQRHLTRSHRLLATLLVFLVVLILIAGLITLFAIPLAREGALFVQQFPHLHRGVQGRQRSHRQITQPDERPPLPAGEPGPHPRLPHRPDRARGPRPANRCDRRCRSHHDLHPGPTDGA